ncbi:hypothetical protein OO012_02685 [Rhodobacteraceae bacterium KMM 6894]|nr:hypothetical protein [Rhodobacteraceae bacterium KMM 6894]
MQANARILSTAGNIAITTVHDLAMDPVRAAIRALAGTANVTVGGDLALALIEAGAGGTDAIRLRTDGVLSVVPGIAGARLNAGRGGAILQLGQISADAPDLITELGTLDILKLAGDVTLRNTGALTVARAGAGNGALALLSGGAMTLTGPVTASGDIELSAAGDLTGRNIDLVGASVSAFSAGDLDLATNAALRLASAGGRTVDVFARGDLSVGEVRTQDNGRINLTAENLISIGTAELEGGRLALTAKGGVIGTADTPFTVNSSVDATFDLASGNVVLVETEGNLTLNAVQAQTVALLAEHGTINNGAIRATRTVLQARDGIGVGFRVAVRDGAISADTQRGNINLLLGDNGTNAGIDKVTLEEVTTTGTGNIVLSGVGADVTVAAGSGVRTDTGNIFVRSRDLSANANIKTTGGAIDIAATGNLVQDGPAPGTNSTVTTGGRGDISAGGAVKLVVGGDLTLARITSQAENQIALDIDVTGTVRNAPGVTIFRFDADERGAQTRLRLGAADPVGPLGLEMQVRELDVVVERGDLHVNNQRSLVLSNAETKAGRLEVFAGNELTFQRAKAAAGKELILASSGNVIGQDAVADADIIGLYAFNGDIRGLSIDSALKVDTKAGAIVSLFAEDEINLMESAGDLTLAYEISEKETLAISGPGDVTVGLAGAAKTLSLSADGALNVGRIGGASIAIDDPVARQLVRSDFYRTVLANAPTTATLTAGTDLTAGIVTAQTRVALSGAAITANLIDATPANGLSVGAVGPGGAFAQTVEIAVLGTGASPLITDPLAVSTGSIAGFKTTHSSAVAFEGLRVGGPDAVANLGSGGPSIVVRDATIAGDVRFAQNGFTVFVQTAAGERNDLDDIHVVTQDGNAVDFSLSNGAAFMANGLTVLNKVVTEEQGAEKTIAEVVDDLIRQTANVDASDDVVGASFVLEEEPGTSRRVLRVISITIRTPRGEQIVRLPLISASLPGSRDTQAN